MQILQVQEASLRVWLMPCCPFLRSKLNFYSFIRGIFGFDRCWIPMPCSVNNIQDFAVINIAFDLLAYLAMREIGHL